MIGTKVGPFYVGGHPVRGAVRGASGGLGAMAWMIIAIVGGAFYVLWAIAWLLMLLGRIARWSYRKLFRRHPHGKPAKIKVVKPTKAERRVVKARAKLVDAQMTDAARRNSKRMPGSTLPPPKVF